MINAALKVPLSWKPIFQTKKNYIAIPCGRVSGKTKNSVIFCVLLLLSHPYHDIAITRASYGSLKDTTYQEFKSAIADLPDEIANQFTFKTQPLKIERANHSGNIYFFGSGGSNKDRTKGFKSEHPLIAVISEETQELKDKASYDQFEASIRRNFGENVKLLILGNPPAIKAHWFNEFIESKKVDRDWLVAQNMTWLDIIDFLNDYDIKEILKCKFLEPDYYKWLYEGVPIGGLGAVYPMFRRETHLINYDERSNSPLLQDYRVVGVIIGVDGAVNKDCTVCVPRFVMANGQTMAGKIFYHNPKTDGVCGSFPLVEKEISRWFRELREENALDNPYNYAASIPIIFVVDSAATELIQALRFQFSNRAEVYAIKKGTIIQMVDVVQSAMGKNVVGIYDYGGYYNYTSNQWVKSENLLARQYESLLWNEKQTGYDPLIPNDVSDADTYGVYFYFKQVENITWLQRVAMGRKDYYLLKNEGN